MKVQNQRWIFPLALIWVAILIFPPTGNASSYGRVTDTEWKPIWEMKEAFNFPLLVIEMVVSGVLVYGTWVLLATRTPRTKSKKEGVTKPTKPEGDRSKNVPSVLDEDTFELLRQYQQTIDYNWSIAKIWTNREEEQLIGALRRRFGKSWKVHHGRLIIPQQGERYSGETLERPVWAGTHRSEQSSIAETSTGSRKCSACGCLLSPTMTVCPRCKIQTPLEASLVACSRCKEVFERAEGACPFCSEGLEYPEEHQDRPIWENSSNSKPATSPDSENSSGCGYGCLIWLLISAVIAAFKASSKGAGQ